ncbi:MAG TPA: tRNA lysidine(34) synthetase TilS [Rhabdochlamydiaceae bacterium]|jgi:tRNA(Ile)-lysidine synthase|nr:tRNA lysidine(34) synthetase TilS [Rhabdochlamydiaceae bacterium]
MPELLKIVKHFLNLHKISERPVILGFSGGADSLALLHLLLECEVDLHVAHIDHGWRAESKQQAEELQAEVDVPFHLKRLEGVPKKENEARQARLAFFKEIYQKIDAQAVILGHHGDDQSETVLKRILEGASLSALKGILPVSSVDGMQIWRPLLGVDKATLKAWLEEKGLKAIEDSTNLDQRYLRGKMRTSILPQLETHFGKEVSGNLRRLGESARELSDYLSKKIEKYEALIIEDKGEKRVDLSGYYPLEPVEIKAFLKKFSEKNKVFLSHAALQSLYTILEKGTLHRKVGTGDRFVEVRGRCVAIKKI